MTVVDLLHPRSACRATCAAPSPKNDLVMTSLVDDVEREMQRLCDTRESVGRIAGEQLQNGGKRLRARLALHAAQALSVRVSAIPWAAAVELLHNATLVHDDVQDGDTLRRGRKTAWAEHGIPQAINTGDMMLMLPMLAIDALDVDDRTARALMVALTSRAIATVAGQGAE